MRCKHTKLIHVLVAMEVVGRHEKPQYGLRKTKVPPELSEFFPTDIRFFRLELVFPLLASQTRLTYFLSHLLFSYKTGHLFCFGVFFLPYSGSLSVCGFDLQTSQV